MIIIKRYCFQIKQLKLWQKQNILYFENNVILLQNINFNILSLSIYLSIYLSISIYIYMYKYTYKHRLLHI